jgi:hypothetical protein
MKLLIVKKGGSGSGDFGHRGIPGHQGGSLSGNYSGRISAIKRTLRNTFPAKPSDELTILAAKQIAEEEDVRYQDILKTITPSNNIVGGKSWNKDGNIIRVR